MIVWQVLGTPQAEWYREWFTGLGYRYVGWQLAVTFWFLGSALRIGFCHDL